MFCVACLSACATTVSTWNIAYDSDELTDEKTVIAHIKAEDGVRAVYMFVCHENELFESIYLRDATVLDREKIELNIRVDNEKHFTKKAIGVYPDTIIIASNKEEIKEDIRQLQDKHSVFFRIKLFDQVQDMRFSLNNFDEKIFLLLNDCKL